LYFNEEALQQLRQGFEALPGKTAELIEKYATRTYSNELAKGFGHHGFMRRVPTLERCIENVFGLVTREQVEPL
jgi:hypothetical protein